MDTTENSVIFTDSNSKIKNALFSQTFIRYCRSQKNNKGFFMLANKLKEISIFYVRQRRELAEFIGFETRNKYSIETEGREAIAYAAEQQKGWLGFLFRQFLGHWRSFDILIFDNDRQIQFRAHHPFRFYFQRIEVRDASDQIIGIIEREFSILTKKFKLLDAQDRTLLTVASPIWKIWTFRFEKDGVEKALIQKKWGGVLKEVFTDGDTFKVHLSDPSLTITERSLILVSSIFIDLQYFEAKAGSSGRIGGWSE
jgi:uncharacterized protein YxjI